MKIKEMIVVEGRNDTTKVQQAVCADTIETRGSALDRAKMETIRLASERRGVVVFTDPDYPGEQIRKKISAVVPGCRHAFLPREQCMSTQGKCGIEHARAVDIRKALEEAHTEWTDAHDPTFTWAYLGQLGLVSGSNSRKLRMLIGNQLGIGYGNAKQFYKRLNAFRIRPSELEEAYKKALQEACHE